MTQIVEWEGEAMPHGVLFPGIPAGEIRRASPSGVHGRLTDKGMIVTSTQLFLLQAEGRTIVIEAGSGNGKTRPNEPYWDHQELPYLETLAAAGVRPDDVEYVFLSHLHPDHVGLATSRIGGAWRPAFPRAEYVLHPAEWQYWNSLTAHPPFIEDSVRPLLEAGCVRFANEEERVGGIRIHESPGHTPGHLLFEAEDAGVWFLGDLLHHPAQAAHPEWPSGDWDIDREGAVSSRKRYFPRLADAGAVALAAHTGDPFQLEATGPGRFLLRYAEVGAAERCLQEA